MMETATDVVRTFLIETGKEIVREILKSLGWGG